MPREIPNVARVASAKPSCKIVNVAVSQPPENQQHTHHRNSSIGLIGTHWSRCSQHLMHLLVSRIPNIPSKFTPQMETAHASAKRTAQASASDWSNTLTLSTLSLRSRSNTFHEYLNESCPNPCSSARIRRPRITQPRSCIPSP